MNNFTVQYLDGKTLHHEEVEANTKGQAIRKLMSKYPKAIIESVKAYNNIY